MTKKIRANKRETQCRGSREKDIISESTNLILGDNGKMTGPMMTTRHGKGWRWRQYHSSASLITPDKRSWTFPEESKCLRGSDGIILRIGGHYKQRIRKEPATRIISRKAALSRRRCPKTTGQSLKTWNKRVDKGIRQSEAHQEGNLRRQNERTWTRRSVILQFYRRTHAKRGKHGYNFIKGVARVIDNEDQLLLTLSLLQKSRVSS